MEVGNITKAANFKSFLHLNYKNTQLQFLLQFFFNIFIRQTLTNDFGGLHKKMNCAFPLVRIQTIDDVINIKIYLRSSSTAMADMKKRGEDGNKKM